VAGRHCLLTRQEGGGQVLQKERRASPPSINLRRVKNAYGNNMKEKDKKPLTGSGS
jgi:hypothetical protein